MPQNSSHNEPLGEKIHMYLSVRFHSYYPPYTTSTSVYRPLTSSVSQLSLFTITPIILHYFELLPHFPANNPLICSSLTPVLLNSLLNLSCKRSYRRLPSRLHRQCRNRLQDLLMFCWVTLHLARFITSLTSSHKISTAHILRNSTPFPFSITCHHERNTRLHMQHTRLLMDLVLHSHRPRFHTYVCGTCVRGPNNRKSCIYD
jgi:hypothetical protein